MIDKYFSFQYSEHPLWKEIVQKRIELRDLNYQWFIGYNLFSLVWWLELILFIAVWFIWWKLVDKSRLVEIVAYGLMVSILATIIDLAGANFVLWGYPIMPVPLMPPLFIVNVGLLPVVYMLVYQYFSSFQSFTKAVLIMAVIFAYAAEPLAVWLGIYELTNWRYSYSFPIYIALALFLKWVMTKILAK
ncbi:MAG TPA: hypothetical protein DEG71_00335, partial [Clostridiales bacterium]|nr:hypothetical protein [Clostridiales bacterium]